MVIKEKFNIKVANHIEDRTKGVSRMESLNVILEEYNKENSLSSSEKYSLATKKNELYKSLIKDFDQSNIFPGVIKLFDYLKEKNILIALGSASKNGPTIIERLGITEYFDYIVNPKDLMSKPHPSIFLDAMNHFNLKSNECIGIEDAISGVQAIKAANMFAIGIGDIEQLNHADVIYKNINEIDYKFLENLID